jgi:hypothetical protein
MLPNQAYQLYQIERPKTAFEMRYADERTARTAAAIAGLLRRLTPASYRRASRPAAPAQGGVEPARAPIARPRSAAPCGCGRMTTTMEVR